MMVQFVPSRSNSIIIKSYFVIIAVRHNAIGPTEIGAGAGSDSTVGVGILHRYRSVSSLGSFRDAMWSDDFSWQNLLRIPLYPSSLLNLLCVSARGHCSQSPAHAWTVAASQDRSSILHWVLSHKPKACARTKGWGEERRATRRDRCGRHGAENNWKCIIGPPAGREK